MSTAAIVFNGPLYGDTEPNQELSTLDFTPGATLTVTSLGAFLSQDEASSSGWTANKTITIWNVSTGAVVAQATVAAGVAKDSGNQSASVALSPTVNLTEGVTYRISAGPWNSDPVYSGAGGSGSTLPSYLSVNFPAGSTYSDTQYYNSTPGQFPSAVNDTTGQICSATFAYTVGSSGTLAWSPASSTAVDSSTTASSTITLTGSSNAITLTLSPNVGSLSTTTPASGASVVYTPPTTGSGSVSVTAAASGVTSQVWTITYGPASSVAFTGYLTCASNTHAGGVEFTFAKATGGSGNYTYKLYRSTSPLYAAGSGTLVATLGPTTASSGLSLTDATPPSVYTYYLATVTDGSTTATALQINLGGGQIYYGIEPCKYDVNITGVGDSITYGVGVTSTTTYLYLAVQALGNIFPDMSFSLNNVAVSGSTTADWLNGTNGVTGTNYAAAVSAYNGAADMNICTVLLGANDCRDDHEFSPSTYATNLASGAGILKTTGYKVLCLGPGFIVQNNASWTNTSVLSNLVAYGQEIINTVADNSTIFGGIDILEGTSIYDQNQTGDGIGDGTHWDSVVHAKVSYIVAAHLARMIEQERGLYGLSTTPGSNATAYLVEGIPSTPVIGEPYAVAVILNGTASTSMVATFGAHEGVTWGATVSIASGATSGTTTATFTATGAFTPTVSHTGGGFSGDPTLSSVSPVEPSGGGNATAYVVTGIPASPVVGEPYTVTISLNGTASASFVATFGALSEVTWGGTVNIASGETSGTTTVTFNAPGTYAPTVTHTGGGFSGDPTLSSSTAIAASVTLSQLNTALASALAAGITTLAGDGLDNIVVETGLNMRQAQSIIAAEAAGSVTTDPSGNVSITGAGVSTPRITAATSGSNRTTTIHEPT